MYDLVYVDGLMNCHMGWRIFLQIGGKLCPTFFVARNLTFVFIYISNVLLTLLIFFII